MPEAAKDSWELVVKSVPVKVSVVFPCCPADPGETDESVGAGPDVTVRHEHAPVPPSGFVTNTLYVRGLAVGETVTVLVSCVELTAVVPEKVAPAWFPIFAPGWKLVPVTVIFALSPRGTEFGVADETVGPGSMVRHPEQVSAMFPGSITVTFLGPTAALPTTRSFTCRDVGELTTTELAVTRVPDTNTDGVPEKPLPVSVTVTEPPWPTALGVTAVIGGPGVVISYAFRPTAKFPATSRSMPAKTGCAKIGDDGDGPVLMKPRMAPEAALSRYTP